MNKQIYQLLASSLVKFRSGCGNDDKYPGIWLKSASLLFDQMNQFLHFVNYNPNRISNVDAINEDNRVLLAQLFNSHGSDKTHTHSYEYVYSNILADLGVSNT